MLKKVLVCKWKTGISKEIGIFSTESERIIMVCDVKEWCNINHFRYPVFYTVEKGG